jgi:hypothetical protein
MRKTLSLITLTAVVLGAAPAFAAQKGDPQLTKVAQEVSNAVVEEVNDTITQNLDKAIQEYAKKKGIVFGENQNGRMFVYKIEPVNRPTSDPYFGQARIAAYERAWLEAQKQIAEYLFKDIFTQTTKKSS